MKKDKIKISDVFDRLDIWKKYPNYQHERRADIYFALFLPDIFCELFGKEISFAHIIPEFPIKSINGSSKDDSIKIDYAVFTRDVLYLVELKTSMKSFYEESNNDNRLSSIAECINETSPFSKLVEYVEKKISNQKYMVLNEHIKRIGISKSSPEKSISLIYILPTKPKKGLKRENTVRVDSYITFDEIADCIENKGKLAKRFSKSLRQWTVTK